MQDPEPQVRRLFVMAASRAGNPALREALQAALDDADPEVREAAAWGLQLLAEQFPL